MCDEYMDKIQQVPKTTELLQQQANSLAEHFPTDDVVHRVKTMQALELPLCYALKLMSVYDFLMYKTRKWQRQHAQSCLCEGIGDGSMHRAAFAQ